MCWLAVLSVSIQVLWPKTIIHWVGKYQQLKRQGQNSYRWIELWPQSRMKCGYLYFVKVHRCTTVIEKRLFIGNFHTLPLECMEHVSFTIGMALVCQTMKLNAQLAIMFRYTILRLNAHKKLANKESETEVCRTRGLVFMMSCTWGKEHTLTKKTQVGWPPVSRVQEIFQDTCRLRSEQIRLLLHDHNNVDCITMNNICSFPELNVWTSIMEGLGDGSQLVTL